MMLSVVIPVFNEKSTIAKIVGRVVEESTPKEIIIVDDGSTDGTREIIEKQKHPALKKIFHPRNLGKGAAVLSGIKEAGGEVLVIQDADLEYDPKYYKSLLQPIILKETSVVYGTRLKELRFNLFGKNKTIFPLHYLANRFLSSLTNLLYSSSLTDMETGYKMMTKEVYRKLNLRARGFDIEPEITAKVLKQGYKIIEVPITTLPRGYKEGKKIKARDFYTAIMTLLKCKFF